MQKVLYLVYRVLWMVKSKTGFYNKQHFIIIKITVRPSIADEGIRRMDFLYYGNKLLKYSNRNQRVLSPKGETIRETNHQKDRGRHGTIASHV